MANLTKEQRLAKESEATATTEVSLADILARINTLETENKRLNEIATRTDSNAVRAYDQSLEDNKTPKYKLGIYKDVTGE